MPGAAGRELQLHHQEHAYLETEGALALPQGDGGVTVYINTQSPFITRNNLARCWGCRRSGCG